MYTVLGKKFINVYLEIKLVLQPPTQYILLPYAYGYKETITLTEL